MKPNHQFSFLRNNAVSLDIAILTKLSICLISGREGVVLYLYLLSLEIMGKAAPLQSDSSII